jgi:formylglycine-generating enzyme required for sulfatase activity
LAQARWLTLSSNSKQIFARNSSEYIQLDEPETVIDAIREIHDQTKPAPSGQKTSATKVGAAFRDCSDCPEMVVIPAGHFMMGSSEVEKAWVASHGGSQAAVADEAPQHEVTLPRFALSKYIVTRSEYATFVRETGRSADDGCGRDSFKWDNDPGLSWQAPGFTQSERDPVVCVSWEDAQAYVTWLNGKARPGVGDGAYRLPSEAEWEYAARAGTTTKFWWGDDESQASTYAWYKDNSGERTHPVGEKPANAFHLYDMAGNVWQWTADCYAENYVGAPTDGHPNENGVSDPRPNGTKKCMRVDRGGSWLYPAWLLRPATRERNPANFRDRIMGFRVAKTLP